MCKTRGDRAGGPQWAKSGGEAIQLEFSDFIKDVAPDRDKGVQHPEYEQKDLETFLSHCITCTTCITSIKKAHQKYQKRVASNKKEQN